MCPVNRKETKMKRQKILIEEKRQEFLRGQVMRGRKKRNIMSGIKKQGLDHRPKGEETWR